MFLSGIYFTLSTEQVLWQIPAVEGKRSQSPPPRGPQKRVQVGPSTGSRNQQDLSQNKNSLERRNALGCGQATRPASPAGHRPPPQGYPKGERGKLSRMPAEHGEAAGHERVTSPAIGAICHRYQQKK